MTVEKCKACLELDEMYWSTTRRPRTETREAEKYCTDGYAGYLDVIYPGKHIWNLRDKSGTFTVEGVNADLQHYIPLLKRRSRCFARSLETLQAVVEVFVDAYNRFGAAKYEYRIRHPKGSPPFALVDFF